VEKGLFMVRRNFLSTAQAIAFVALALQMWPLVGRYALEVLDVRTWSRGVWLSANVAAILLLLTISRVPGVVSELRGRREEFLKSQSKAKAVEELRCRRQAIAEINKSRRNRIY
jgi:hypothetical protein